MTIQKRRIKKLVDQLLTDCRIRGPRVDVEKIANLLQIKVVRTKADDELSGFIRRSVNKVIIGINDGHGQKRQRFTIAHELGHFILHGAGNFHVDRKRTFLRNDESGKGINKQEIEANTFAAELLMPSQFVEKEWEKFSTVDVYSDSNEEAIDEMAKKFDVSVQAMAIRLANLGIIQLT